MPAALDLETIEELWQEFKTAGPGSGEVVTLEGLRAVMRRLGHEASDEALSHMLFEADSQGSVTFERFRALVASLQGDLESRLALAFEVFDHDGDGRVAPDEMRAVLGPFGLSEAELQRIYELADRDGDGAIDFEEFRGLMPAAREREARRYRSALDPMAAGKTLEVHPDSLPPDGGEPRLHEAAPHRRAAPGRGTSRLQMQIGLFRLLQGAAYRSFRENYCANYETHLRATKLPYTFPQFVEFVHGAIALYKALGVVEPDCFCLLDELTASLDAEAARLRARVEGWPTVAKTPEMAVCAAAMSAGRDEAVTLRQKFAAGVEYALTLRKKELGLADIVEDLLAVHELNRLRRQELHHEMAPPPSADGSDPKAYLAVWNRVLLDSAEEEVEGAMMPAAYWYEDFMPKLLAACSAGTAGDLAANREPDEAVLDRWFAAAREAGEFARYGADVAAHFPDCGPRQKLSVRQAWRLTRHYLNGVEKRRERLELGRESGDLSQYVAFLDVYLGRSHVRDARMRVSFPYYLGPAVWRFLHTAAEIVCAQKSERQRDLVALFKDFFRLFATQYPCPYCRFHLNDYVVRNREVELYPLEYLVLGRDPGRTDFKVTLDDKLACVMDGPSLRLFLWKLHNTVSASIVRTEAWYHRDGKPFYTTRHWPGLEAELARARALNEASLPLERLTRSYGLLKPAARLAGLRAELCGKLERREETGLAALCDEANAVIADLDAALAAGAFLQETYAFDPDLDDEAPHFTPEEEAFGRSGLFVEA